MIVISTLHKMSDLQYYCQLTETNVYFYNNFVYTRTVRQ